MFFLLFEQGLPHFHFVLGPTNYAVFPVQYLEGSLNFSKAHRQPRSILSLLQGTCGSIWRHFFYHHNWGPVGFLGGASDKESTCQCRRRGFNPWVGKIPWRRAWQPTPVFLPGESPRSEEPDGLQFMGSQRVGDDWVSHTHTNLGVVEFKPPYSKLCVLHSIVGKGSFSLIVLNLLYLLNALGSMWLMQR